MQWELLPDDYDPDYVGVDDDPEPAIEDWQLVSLDDLDEWANAADEQSLDYFNHYIAGDR